MVCSWQIQSCLLSHVQSYKWRGIVALFCVTNFAVVSAVAALFPDLLMNLIVFWVESFMLLCIWFTVDRTIQRPYNLQLTCSFCCAGLSLCLYLNCFLDIGIFQWRAGRGSCCQDWNSSGPEQLSPFGWKDQQHKLWVMFSWPQMLHV